jgi:hypothetical protein
MVLGPFAFEIFSAGRRKTRGRNGQTYCRKANKNTRINFYSHKASTCVCLAVAFLRVYLFIIHHEKNVAKLEAIDLLLLLLSSRRTATA